MNRTKKETFILKGYGVKKGTDLYNQLIDVSKNKDRLPSWMLENYDNEIKSIEYEKRTL